MTDPVANPPHQSLFAFWRWHRGVWWVVALLTPVCYFLSLPLAFYMIHASRTKSQILIGAIDLFYYPATVLSWHYEILNDLWTWEYMMLYWMFGQPRQ